MAESPRTRTRTTSSGSKIPSPIPSTSGKTSTRRTRHRHTQSLGLLSPIPSRSSLGDQDELESNPNTPSPQQPKARARTPPPRTGTPSSTSASVSTSTVSNTNTSASTAPSTPRRDRVRASLPPLPALLASLSALFPSSTPSSPKVALSPSPIPAPSSGLPAMPPTTIASPQPRRPGSSSYSPLHPTSPSPAPSTSNNAASRSEQLLRDALRRGSVSSGSRPVIPSRTHSRSNSISHHPHPAQTRTQQTANGGAYGGDAEFSSSSSHSHSPQPHASSQALAHTLSRLEGRDRGAGERDPEHEALRARLERVLAMSGGGGAGERRTSMGSRRASEQRSSLTSSASAGSSHSHPLENERERERTSTSTSTSTPRPHTPLNRPHTPLNRPHTPLNRPHTPLNNANSTPKSPRTPTPRDGFAQGQEREREWGTPRSARRIGSFREGDEDGLQGLQYREQQQQGQYHSPHLQYHTTASPHSPLLQHSPLVQRSASPLLLQHSPHLYSTTAHRTQSPRSPRAHTLTLALDSNELARRNTHTPTGSPRRPQFTGYGSASASPVSPSRGLHRSASPSTTLSRDGTERGHGRARSRTEPVVEREQYGIGAETERERERERERQMQMQMQRERGHARKSSAYAALAALSGLGGAGGAHPTASARYQGNGHAHPQNGYIAHNPGTQNGHHGNGPPTPGSTPPLSADVRDEVETSESEVEESDEGHAHAHVHGTPRMRRGGRLLTPPATPPRCKSLVVVAGVDGLDDAHAHGLVDADGGVHGHDGEARPTFNARKASAQCRQLEGYVSFSAVEGLGEPPSPGPEGDLDDDEPDSPGKRKRGSLGAGIVGLWRGGFW
ncbi:hypothetical protein B0H19DRAFT_69163 [Mycena capillaripes]|nr:hypothetical protein B0H19DRAFT_69163 [Mycena capillaripes]